MTPAEEIITRFYTAFQAKDATTMGACYADNAVFNDPVFRDLNAQEVRSMWTMLITRGKDLELEFSQVSGNDRVGSAEWKATYTFSGTGRKVVNHIHASFEIENGKIVRHTDRFSFSRWAKQALGLKAVLLGWTGLVQKKVRKSARQQLEKFMQRPASH